MRVVGGDGGVQAVVCCMGDREPGTHPKSLKDQLAVLGDGVHPSQDSVLDAAWHALDVDWKPVGVKLS